MSADCSLQVVESQHRSGDLILANDNFIVELEILAQDLLYNV